MAQGFFNKYAPGRYRAVSAGTKPAAQINPLAVQAMGEVGIILSGEVSRLSRTDKDRCHLLEVCRVFDTLLAESDRIGDRLHLVLGMHGFDPGFVVVGQHAVDLVEAVAGNAVNVAPRPRIDYLHPQDALRER